MTDNANPAANQQGPPPATPGRAALPLRLLGGLLRTVGWLLGTLILLTLLLVVLVLGTQTGLRMAVGVAEDLVPEMITVGAVEGRILGRLGVDDLRLRLPGLEVDVGELVLDWSPAALLGGTLRVAELIGRDIAVATAPSEDPEPLTLPEISLPIGLDLDRALVERLRFGTIGAPPAAAIVIDRIDLSATLVAERVDIRTLEARLTQPALSASATGEARLTGAYPIDLDLAWAFTQAPALRLTGSGRATGDLEALHIEHRIEGSVAATLDATLRSVLDQPAWDGSITVTEVRLPELVPEAPAVAIAARLETSGNLDDAHLNGRITGSTTDLPDLGELAADIELGWADEVLTIRTLRLRETLATDGDTPTPAVAAADTTLTADPATDDVDVNAGLDLKGSVDLRGSAPAFDLAGDWVGLRWPLVGPAQVQSPSGQVTLAGDLDAFRFGLNAGVLGEQIPEANLRLTGTGTPAAIDITALAIDTLGGRLAASGTVQLEPALVWDLTLTGNGLDPGQQIDGLDGQVSLEAGSQGGLDAGFDYQVMLDAALADYPAVTLTVSGAGTTEAVGIERLLIETLDGRIEGSAEVTLAPELAWDARLTLADLNPGQTWADWPGRIGGRVASRGRLGPDGPDLTAQITDLGGQLRGYPARVAAALSMQGEAIRIEQLEASSGNTRLSASGSAAEQLDLRFALRSPDLAALLPDARGSLDLAGRIEGPRAAPRLDLTLGARAVGLGDPATGLSLARLDGTARFALVTRESAAVGDAPAATSITGSTLNLQLDASGLRSGDQTFDTLTLNATGTLADHRLALGLTGEPLGLQLAASGGLSDAGSDRGTDSGSYRGSLERLDLTPPADLPPLTLARPAPLRLAGGRVEAGPLCLAAPADSGACVRFTQPEPGRFEATLDSPRLDFALLAPLLPETVAATGFVRANARVNGVPAAAGGSTITGNAAVELPTAVIDITLPANAERLVLTGSRLDLQVAGNGVTASLALPIEGVGGVDAQVGLPGLRPGVAGAPPPTASPLTGSVTARVDDLGRFSTLVPDAANLRGSIGADLRLGGTLGAPQLGGSAAVNGAGLTLPLIGLELAELNLRADGRNGDGFVLAGSALLGGRRLDLGGSASGLVSGNPVADFTLRGERIKVADSSEYFALVSLDLRGGLGPGGAALAGEIKVPEARIMPRAVAAGAIRPSPDVRILGSEEGQPPLPVSVDIRARLGDDVNIDAFGLRGRLAGNLNIVKPPTGDLVGNGQLEVIDGTFRVSLPGLGLVTSLGAPLRIEQGIVNFANTPLTNPGLVLSAVRQGGDLTAGVQVLGTLQNPKLAFFSDSDPDMSQAEITKYLVTGIPPGGANGANEQGISVGRYLAPRLFIEYESSLGNQSDNVRLRYDVNNRVQLQTETGDSQGADIFFKFEN